MALDENRGGRWRRDIGYTLLVVPLVLFLVLVFVWPVARYLALGVDNSGITAALPRTISSLSDWSATSGAPPEAAFVALVDDLSEAQRTGRSGELAQLINQRITGTRLLLIRTAKDAAEGKFGSGPRREAVLSAHPGWSDVRLWSLIARQTSPVTDHYLLASMDLQRNAACKIEPVPAERAIFVPILLRTIWISGVATLICILLSLPLAQAIVSAPPLWSRAMFALVLVPLWTSLLVRTVIWVIVLQKNGPVNSALIGLGISDHPLNLIYTRFSLYVAMVQVLLPIMVLSIVSVMRRIPPTHMRAALSLGAPWFTAWRRVQLPLVAPGILAGSAIVFVFALGYYITPALVGGPTEQMASGYIDFYTNQTLNWGMSAALSIQLLMILLVAIFLFWTARWLLGGHAGKQHDR